MIFYYGSEKFDKIPRNKNLICGYGGLQGTVCGLTTDLTSRKGGHTETKCSHGPDLELSLTFVCICFSFLAWTVSG